MTRKPSGWLKTAITDDAIAEAHGATDQIAQLPVERWSDRLQPSLTVNDDRTTDLDNRLLRDRMNALARELNALRSPDNRILHISVLCGTSDSDAIEVTTMTTDELYAEIDAEDIEHSLANIRLAEPPWGLK